MGRCLLPLRGDSADEELTILAVEESSQFLGERHRLVIIWLEERLKAGWCFTPSALGRDWDCQAHRNIMENEDCDHQENIFGETEKITKRH